MSTKAKFNVNLKEGTFEIEGSEEFVKTTLAAYKPLFLPSEEKVVEPEEVHQANESVETEEPEAEQTKEFVETEEPEAEQTKEFLETDEQRARHKRAILAKLQSYQK